MRAGFTKELERRIRRTDRQARVIVEAAAVVSEDAVQTYDDWGNADSLTGLTRFTDGRVEVTGSNSTLLDRTTDDSSDEVLTTLPTGPTFVAAVEWAGTQDPSTVLTFVEAELDPDVDAGGQEVVEWVCQLWGVSESVDDSRGDGTQQIFPLTKKLYVTAPTSAQRVEFDFTTGAAVRPIELIRLSEEGKRSLFSAPTMLVHIYGVDADGAIAGNCGWRVQSGTSASSYSQNGLKLTGRNVTTVDQVPFGFQVEITADNIPNLLLKTASYTSQTLDFTTNPLDLGATPTETVQFTFLGMEPGATSLTYYIRNDADTAWVEANDGDTTDDLAGVGKRQTYEFRVVFTPTTNVTPILWAVAVRELTVYNLDGLASVTPRGSLAIDPVTLRGEIMEYDIQIIRDGRRDFNDLATFLGAEHSLDGFEFDIFIGHPDLDRADWLLVDRALVDDHTDDAEAITYHCLGANRELAQPIPPIVGTGSLTEDPLTYGDKTLKYVWDDILTGQIQLRAHHIGPGVEETGVNVTNVLENSTAQDVLDEIAYIAGGGVIASQGQIKFRQLYDLAGVGVRAVWTKSETTAIHVAPGARYRSPRAVIKYNYNWNDSKYNKQYQSQHDNAVSQFGVTALTKVNVPDKVSKWVTADADAETLTRRIVTTMGHGLILWRLRTQMPYPELEPGDVVAVEVDEFVSLDPNAARYLKGNQMALGVITAQHDVWGTEFDVWVQDVNDIRPTETPITRTYVKNALSLLNFRVSVQGSTYVRLAWELGELVSTVRVYNQLLAVPSTGDPWKSSTEAPTATINSTSAQVYDLGYPNANQARYVQLFPRSASGAEGDQQRYILSPPRPPVINTDFAEDGETATLWASVQGLGVKAVEFRRQSGRGTASTYAAATRVGSAGSTIVSVVKGGTLGAGQYEEDVTLANDQNSFIWGRAELYNGDYVHMGPFTYDRNTLPTILQVGVNAQNVTATADTDTRSILLKRLAGGWRNHQDGSGYTWDVEEASTGGAGIGSTDSWTMRVVAFSKGKVSASTNDADINTRDVVVRGPLWGSTAPTVPSWASPYPSATAPSTGSAVVGLNTRATVSSTSYPYYVERRYQVNSKGYSAWEDISTNISGLGNASTSVGNRSWTSDHAATLSSAPAAVVEYQFKFNILDSTGGVVDTSTKQVVWESNSTASTM